MTLVIQQKVIDDAYVNKWVWHIIDEERKIHIKGEEKTLKECHEKGLVHLHKLNKKKK